MPKIEKRPDKLFEVSFVQPLSEAFINELPNRANVRPRPRTVQVLADTVEDALAQVYEEFPDAIVDAAVYICGRVADKIVRVRPTPRPDEF